MISFYVKGKPIPQGSAKAFMAGGKARIVTGAKSEGTPLGGWRARIAEFASRARGEQPMFTGAVAVNCYFYFERPASNKAVWPVSRRVGDIDKLERALLDGLTGVLFADDSQVVSVVKQKMWTCRHYVGYQLQHDPGVAVEVWEA